MFALILIATSGPLVVIDTAEVVNSGFELTKSTITKAAKIIPRITRAGISGAIKKFLAPYIFGAASFCLTVGASSG